MASTLEAMRGRGVPDAILWVLQDNPRARRFYEREGWREDGAAESDYLGVTVALTRYRIDL
jgi:GNAT superfamily N-acetyltransferase